MRSLGPIRARLLIFSTASIVITAVVAIVATLLFHWNHSEEAALHHRAVTAYQRSHTALANALSTQNALQALLRLRDPDEIEPALKRYETARALFAQTLGGASELTPLVPPLAAAGKLVVDEVLLANNAGALEHFITKFNPQLEATVAALEKSAAAIEKTAASTVAAREILVRRMLIGAMSLLAVVLAFLAFVAWRFLHSITDPLTILTNRLGSAAEALHDLSNTVTRTSQTVSEGASNQASSLEETSASLEEFSSTTARNAENAARATSLSKHTRTAAEAGAADMQTMTSAMAAIRESSASIGKIIKTIDEIAFQTNILALNAAVEAARAGEAGMGFAVVAEEVRALAHRSAAAARETADKIEDAIRKSENGAAISTKVAAGLQEIVGKAREVDELVADIAGASREQTQGINQVLSAVSQIDHVTQSNAAGAEETAAATVEMNGEVAVLHTGVAELRALLGVAPPPPAPIPSAPAARPTPAGLPRRIAGTA